MLGRPRLSSDDLTNSGDPKQFRRKQKSIQEAIDGATEESSPMVCVLLCLCVSCAGIVHLNYETFLFDIMISSFLGHELFVFCLFDTALLSFVALRKHAEKVNHILYSHIIDALYIFSDNNWKKYTLRPNTQYK